MLVLAAQAPRAHPHLEWGGHGGYCLEWTIVINQLYGKTAEQNNTYIYSCIYIYITIIYT